MLKQAIIYTRFSPRPSAGDCMSCEFQEQKCQEYCESHGLDVLAVYHDKRFSGKQSCKRPGLEKALYRVCNLWEGVLVVYNLARLARSTKEAITLTKTLERNHAFLVIVKQKIDTSSMDRNFPRIMAAISDIECETKGENIRFVLLDMQKHNHKVSRFPPYGSMIDTADDTRLAPNMEEIVTIEKIMNLHNEGYTLQEICEELTRMCRKPRGKAWYAGTIRRIIAKYTNQGV
jgi:DNA invertase Pin-like site-specific DNA recombinase